jgi:hypothetical protein
LYAALLEVMKEFLDAGADPDGLRHMLEDIGQTMPAQLDAALRCDCSKGATDAEPC